MYPTAGGHRSVSQRPRHAHTAILVSGARSASSSVPFAISHVFVETAIFREFRSFACLAVFCCCCYLCCYYCYHFFFVGATAVFFIFFYYFLVLILLLLMLMLLLSFAVVFCYY